MCNTKEDLRELIKSVRSKNRAWTEAMADACIAIDAGTQVAIISQEPDVMPAGGKVVKVRALLPGSSRVGYASRAFVEDR